VNRPLRQPGVKTDSRNLNLAYLKKWRKVLRETANAALTLVYVPEDERKELEVAVKDLGSFDELIEIIRILPSRHVGGGKISPQKRREHDHVFGLARHLCAVIGASFVIGSHASQSKTQISFKHRTDQTKRGKASGKKRAVRPWHKPAEAYAIKKRAARPYLSNSQIAQMIWENVPGAPSGRQVQTLLARLEQDGKLPPQRRH
jgi:hypothetical protein